MEQIKITRDDLKLIQDLSVRVYSGNTMSSNATDGEKEHFMLIKKKLKAIASLFAEKYKQFGHLNWEYHRGILSREEGD